MGKFCRDRRRYIRRLVVGNKDIAVHFADAGELFVAGLADLPRQVALFQMHDARLPICRKAKVRLFAKI